ncbi:hypothetical protein ACHAXR_003003 [Thalassiosira sp. AJA248-18]
MSPAVFRDQWMKLKRTGNRETEMGKATLLRSAARAGLQSASIMAVADITTQLLVEKRSIAQYPPSKQTIAIEDATTSLPPPRHYDPMRTVRWAVVGLTLHGPYFFLSFGKLDRTLGAATNIFIVAKKTAAAQLIVFPPYLLALFTYMGVMEEGNSTNTDVIMAKVQDRVPKAFFGGCIFWPIANFINFSFVSVGARVPYLAAVGGLWNGYLSYMNGKIHDG